MCFLIQIFIYILLYANMTDGETTMGIPDIIEQMRAKDWLYDQSGAL